MDLPIKNLQEPTKERLLLLRRVDMTFVQALKDRIIEDDSGIGIPPLAVVCKSISVKDAFEMRLRKVYSYEVQGGLHGLYARKELLKQRIDVTDVVSCNVYAGLTDEEALWLATRHNSNGHFNHAMTHREYVSAIIYNNNYYYCPRLKLVDHVCM